MSADYSNLDIDPELLPGLALMPPGLGDLTRETVAQVRAVRAELNPPAIHTPVASSELHVPGPDGEVRVVVYQPPGEGPMAGVLWIHGGGYVLGVAEDDRARLIAEELGCVVVSVDYRLAPEFPFPAGVEDCYASLVWMVEQAATLGIDPARVAIAGQSGGGGLAAGLALYNRDQGGPSLALQLLLYPMIDNLHATASGRIENHPVWDRATSLRAWEMYLNGEPGEAASPYAAASRASDLAGLPPAYICVGSEDLFRDECIDYAQRLIGSRVATELAVFPGLYHGADLFLPQAKVSQRLHHGFLRALADALAG